MPPSSIYSAADDMMITNALILFLLHVRTHTINYGLPKWAKNILEDKQVTVKNWRVKTSSSRLGRLGHEKIHRENIYISKIAQRTEKEWPMCTFFSPDRITKNKNVDLVPLMPCIFSSHYIHHYHSSHHHQNQIIFLLLFSSSSDYPRLINCPEERKKDGWGDPAQTR